MKIVYSNQTKGKSYSDDEDRFLLVELAKYGIGKDDTYDRIKRDINEWPAFRFDWFLKSVGQPARSHRETIVYSILLFVLSQRTAPEIGRRCQTLIGLVEREFAPEGGEEEGTKKRGGRKSTGEAGTSTTAAGGAKGKRKAPATAGDGASDASRASTPAGPAAKKAKK